MIPSFIFLGDLLRLLRCDLTVLSKFYSFFGICVGEHLYHLFLVLILLIQILKHFYLFYGLCPCQDSLGFFPLSF